MSVKQGGKQLRLRAWSLSKSRDSIEVWWSSTKSFEVLKATASSLVQRETANFKTSKDFNKRDFNFFERLQKTSMDFKKISKDFKDFYKTYRDFKDVHKTCETSSDFKHGVLVVSHLPLV